MSRLRTDILVIGAGQTGLSAAYHLKRLEVPPVRGRRAVKFVEDRVRAGLPPQSVVSVTGLPLTPRIRAMQARGVLTREPPRATWSP